MLATGTTDSSTRASIPLFWRLFIPNACVLVAACAVLIVEPANGRVPVLVGGVSLMLAVNVVLMRRAFEPLMRLTALMDAVDPLRPGQRVPPAGPPSEVTVLSRAFNAMLDRIETERRESARRAAADEETERRHLAAELHDEIGQSLTALILQLGRLAAAGGPQRADLDEALATAETTLEDVRRLARRLRPEVLDELGLVPALSALCSRLSRQTGVLIHRALPAAVPRLTSDEELAVYRVAQESLTNVVRHSGAQECRLELTDGPDGVELVVSDDGVGTPDATASNGGMRTMRERAVLIGGEISWSRSQSGGTVVRLRVPAGGVEA